MQSAAPAASGRAAWRGRAPLNGSPHLGSIWPGPSLAIFR